MRLIIDATGRVTGAEVTVPFGDPGFAADADLVFAAMVGHLEDVAKLPGFEPSGRTTPGDLLDSDGNVIATGDADAFVDALTADLKRRAGC